MTSERPTISVIIPTYNNAHIVPAVVESVFKQNLVNENFEVIVVDDGSTDGSDMELDSYRKKPNFLYIYQSNKGRSAARNQGISKAKGEILLFLDSDKVIAPDVLEHHLAYQKKFPQTAVIGQTLLPDDVLNANVYMQVTHEGEVKPPRRKLPFSYFVTGNLSVAKELVEKAGSFDETFKVYGWEDSELGLRLERLGVKLLYNPEIVCYHHHVHTLTSQIELMRKLGHSAWVFSQKINSWSLKLFLGIHPLNFGLFKLGELFPGKLEKIKTKIKDKEAENNKVGLLFLYNLVKQYHYIQGYRDAKGKASG